jgi:hypothetical protein
MNRNTVTDPSLQDILFPPNDAGHALIICCTKNTNITFLNGSFHNAPFPPYN